MIMALIRGLEGMARLGTAGAALALLLLFLLGLAEILIRLFLSSSSGIAVEYGGYLLAASLFLGLGGAAVEDRHIRFAPLADRLPRHAARGLEIAATAIGLVIALFLALALIMQAARSLAIDARSYFPSATPLAIPQAILALGPLLLVAGLLARLLRLFFPAGGEGK
ncbi:MAG: hypothetical protein Tsb008_14000 [Rhodothalassiaceae bacterium]